MLLSLLFLTLAAAPTDSIPFSADYRFAEGVYLSHTSLLANEPDLGWEAIDGEMVQLPEDFRVQIADYGYKDVRLDPAILPYAISLDGEAYFFVRADAGRDFYEFTGLRSKGSLSTMSYDTTVTVRQLMKAYNPANGRPFREAYVERDRKLTLNRILHLRSGARFPLNRETVLRLCADDPEITRALDELREPDGEVLRRAVRLYAVRRPLLLPIR